MSLLAVRIGAGVLALLALVALRGKRWAYFGFVVLGLLYYPAQAHFQFHAPKCDQILPTLQQIVPLLHNYLYLALFAGFYWMSWVQLRDANARVFWALLATVGAAVLFEIADGMTVVVAAAKTARQAKAATAAALTHCRAQDLVPAFAGALGAAVLLAIWARLTKKPGYVRLVGKRRAPAPLPPAPTRPAIPARAIVYDPAKPPPTYAPPPAPPDFSPGPTTEASEVTEEVAPSKTLAARAAIAQRWRALLEGIRPALGRIWLMIRGRSRAIVVGAVVLVVLVAAGALVLQRLTAPTPVATVQPVDTTPVAPPPPPPRPLQSEVEGYYEPTYKFTVFDRRFTRLTLRPSPSVTFARPGTRQEVPCEDARINRDAVLLRCTIEPYGKITVDGRFPARYATSKLDMPVLSAVITVTNARGEVQYRARDQFYWHVPDEMR